MPSESFLALDFLGGDLPRKKVKIDDWTKIRSHLFIASRELLLAASGIISLCQKEGMGSSSPQLSKTLSKAARLAEDFAKGMINTKSFSDLTTDMLVPIIRMTEKPTSQTRKTKMRKEGK